MSDQPLKVYVGRRSMCMGDDINVPNMASFPLPNTIEELFAALNRILPFESWTCFPGLCVKHCDCWEDGIEVPQASDSHMLAAVTVCQSTDGTQRHVRTFDSDWHERIQKHPYLYCQ